MASLSSSFFALAAAAAVELPYVTHMCRVSSSIPTTNWVSMVARVNTAVKAKVMVMVEVMVRARVDHQ